jgi:hypothetical protein
LNFNEQQRTKLAASILKRLFTFDQTVDSNDFENLNKFLEDTNADVKPFAGAIFEQLQSAESCDLSGWFSKGANVDALPYIANAMEPSAEPFAKLAQFLDSVVCFTVAQF